LAIATHPIRGAASKVAASAARIDFFIWDCTCLREIGSAGVNTGREWQTILAPVSKQRGMIQRRCNTIEQNSKTDGSNKKTLFEKLEISEKIFYSNNFCWETLGI